MYSYNIENRASAKSGEEEEEELSGPPAIEWASIGLLSVLKNKR